MNRLLGVGFGVLCTLVDGRGWGGGGHVLLIDILKIRFFFLKPIKSKACFTIFGLYNVKIL